MAGPYITSAASILKLTCPSYSRNDLVLWAESKWEGVGPSTAAF